MKNLKTFEDYSNKDYEKGKRTALSNYPHLQKEKEGKPEWLGESKNLSIELENKLRNLKDDSKLTVDDFVSEFGIDPNTMSDFAFAAILKGAEQYKEMSDEEFSKVYNDYKESDNDEEEEYENEEEDDDEEDDVTGDCPECGETVTTEDMYGSKFSCPNCGFEGNIIDDLVGYESNHSPSWSRSMSDSNRVGKRKK
jgi:hypothetical protein